MWFLVRRDRGRPPFQKTNLLGGGIRMAESLDEGDGGRLYEEEDGTTEAAGAL